MNGYEIVWFKSGFITLIQMKDYRYKQNTNCPQYTYSYDFSKIILFFFSHINIPFHTRLTSTAPDLSNYSISKYSTKSIGVQSLL